MFSIAQNVLGKLDSLALEGIVLAWGVRSELQKLRDKLYPIVAMLLDAQEQEQQTKNNLLEYWLGKIKCVIYEIDDVVEEIEMKALQQKVDGGSNISKVCHFFSGSNQLVFRFKMYHKIKEVRERLDQLVNDHVRFRFRFIMSQPLLHRPIIHREREMTHPSIHASDVIGRNDDIENIVKILMCSADHENVSIIPIIGIGGLGKTTLAKMVFNDERVLRHFNLRRWVYVSEEFELKKLIQDIIGSETSAQDPDDLSIDQLSIKLRETLNSKRYLLILDDVWNRDLEKWLAFKQLLENGYCGSKIIVTTRDAIVASIVGNTKTYELKGLSHDECVSLFAKWAFKEGHFGLENQRRLMKIGEQIVRKCNGVPLTVKTLGRMLYMNNDESEWVFVRDKEIWKLEQSDGDILPVLRFSYDQMPSHLRQCFAYCSVYPKDVRFCSIELIHCWMAHGFIQPSNKEKALEDVGLHYIHELCALSFFKDVEDHGYFILFNMPDIVHNLALFVAKLEHATINDRINHDEETSRQKNMPISRKFQYIAFGDYAFDSAPSEVLSDLLEVDNLRSIHFQFPEVGPTSKSFVKTFVPRFKSLRLLDLSYSTFEMLPSSVGQLKHLRFLKLSHNCSIKSLPNTICKLVYLQTLLINGCTKLEKFPRDFGKLISLRWLWVTTQEMYLWGKGGFGSNNCMTSLRILDIVGCNNLESLFDDNDADEKNGIQCLTNLHTLAIQSCARLLSLPRGMRYLTALQNLAIRNCENLDLRFNSQVGEDVGRIGSGLWSLRSLTISGLPKLVALPPWLVQEDACNTLKHIEIADCTSLLTLPDWMMQDPNSFQKLSICNCPKLTSLSSGMHSPSPMQEFTL